MFIEEKWKILKNINEKGEVFYTNEKNDFHRSDGPSIELSNGTRKWCKNGLLHRLDGPAIEWYDGTEEYWIEGKKYHFKQEYLDDIDLYYET